jgi:cell division protein FtsL
MWGFFLRWIWIHVASGLLALGKIIFLAAVVIFLSLIFTTPKEDGMGVNVKIEKSNKATSKKEDSSSDLAKGVEKDTVAEFLLDLKKDTKLDFSKIEDDEVIWPAERIKLELQKAKSFEAEDLSAKDFDKLQKYFIDLDADNGGIGYTFTRPGGTQSAGFALKGEEHSGMMCVLVGLINDGVSIGCGWGPNDNPNSK